MPTKCMPVAEVAELLGVSRQAVYDLINRGDLKAVHVGKRMTVPEAEFERFIAAGGTRVAS